MVQNLAYIGAIPQNGIKQVRIHWLLDLVKVSRCVTLPLVSYQGTTYTPLAVVSRARKTLRVSTTATIAQIPAVSSKEGTVIGAVLST
jgi:hypothetical protein